MKSDARRLIFAVAAAALLWFYMFSPWTAGRPNFWLVMCCSAAILTTLAVSFTPKDERKIRIERPLLQIVAGVAIAFALWGIFWIGDKASQWLFSFARPEVDAVYSMKTGLPVWLIGLLLLVLILTVLVVRRRRRAAKRAEKRRRAEREEKPRGGEHLKE